MPKELKSKLKIDIDTNYARQQLKSLYGQLSQLTNSPIVSGRNQLGITQDLVLANKYASELKYTIGDSVNPLTGNLNLSKFIFFFRMKKNIFSQIF